MEFNSITFSFNVSMKKLIFKYCSSLLLIILFMQRGAAQQTIQINPSQIVLAPSDTYLWEAWKNELHKVRTDVRKKINYSDAL